MPVIIVKNANDTDLMIDDLGIEIPAASSVNLSEIYELMEIIASDDLKAHVRVGNILINDGVRDLTVDEGFNHIRFKTAFENNNDGGKRPFVGRYPPAKVQDGDLWMSSIDGILYLFEDRRGKWLSVSRQNITFSHNGRADRMYLPIGNAPGSHSLSYPLQRPITVTSVNATSSRWFFSSKSKKISILDKSGNFFDFNLCNGEFKRDFLNLDASEQLKCFVWRRGWSVRYPVVTVEFAWRYKA